MAAELGASSVIPMELVPFGPSLCTPYGLYEAKPLAKHHFGLDFTVVNARKSKANLPMLAINKCKVYALAPSSFVEDFC